MNRDRREGILILVLFLMAGVLIAVLIAAITQVINLAVAFIAGWMLGAALLGFSAIKLFRE